MFGRTGAVKPGLAYISPIREGCCCSCPLLRRGDVIFAAPIPLSGINVLCFGWEGS